MKFKIDFYLGVFCLMILLNIVTVWEGKFGESDTCCREFMFSELVCVNTPTSEPVTAIEVRTSLDGKNWNLNYFVSGNETSVQLPAGSVVEYQNACNSVVTSLPCLYNGEDATLFIFDCLATNSAKWESL